MTAFISDALAELRRQFSAQLSSRMESIQSHFTRLSPSSWQLAEVEELHRLVHGLTGSAGTFGMQSVSDAARAVEIRLAELLRSGKAPGEVEWQAIGLSIDHLERLALVRLHSSAPSLRPPLATPRLDHSSLIHLVEDDPEQAAHLSQAMRDAGYRVRVFLSPDSFRAAFQQGDEPPDAVVMDMVFAEGEAAGAALIQELGIGKETGIPVVVASVRDDLPGRLAAFRAGASRYLSKPVETGRLLDLLDAFTGRQPPQPFRVLLVDDDLLLLDTHAAILRTAGMEVDTLSEPLLTLDRVEAFKPDVLLLDVYMPDASGPELATVLRERDAYLHLPILFLSAETDMTQQLLALNLGGDDFLVKPIQPDYLIAAVAARARRARQNNAIRQRLQTTLYEREREHLALDHHAIVSIADRTGRITYVNDKFCEISGYTRKELIGQSHRIVKSDQHSPAFFLTLWRTISAGNVWQGEVCNRRKDGSLYWVESTITPFLDSDGIPYQYVSMRTDISHIKATETALRENEARLNHAQSVAHLGSFEWEVESGRLNWSDEHYRLWGLEPDSVTPSLELFWKPVHPDDRAEVDERLQQALSNKAGLDVVYRITWSDGSEHVMHSLGECSFDANGKALKMIGSVQDITERKLAQDALRESEYQLKEAQALAHVGSWQVDMVSGEGIWSDENYSILGYAPGAIKASVQAFFDRVHPDDLASVQAFATRVQLEGYGELEHRIVQPDGSIRHVHQKMHGENDASGHLLRLTGVMQDITDRVVAEMERRWADEALRESEIRLRATLESTKDGILAVDNAGHVIFANRQFFDLWKIPETLALPGQLDQRLLESVLVQLVDPAAFLDRVSSLYQSDQESYDQLEFTDGRIFERHSKPLLEAGRLTGRVWSFHDVTETRRAEQAADYHKERLRRGQIYANIGTWEWSIQTGELFWTERIAPLFGYPEGELETSYDNFVAAIHPDDRKLVMDAVGACVEHDVPYDIEHRVVWPDGTERWLQERGAVVRDAAGTPMQMLGVVQDIDDRKRAELALIERERQLHEAQSLARIGNWSADLRTGKLVWSDEIYRIFGYAPGAFEPSVEAFHAAVHPDDREKVSKSEKLAEKTGRHDVVHRIVRPDGTVRHVHELAQAEANAEGQLVRMTGTVQDVTDQIESKAKLHESEERFSFAVEGAGDGIWDWNMLTGEMALSGHYEAMLGYAPGELEPTVEAWMKSVHPDDLKRVQQDMKLYLEGKRAVYAPELRLRCKDGHYKWILCRGTVVGRDSQGNPVRMIGIHSDISDHKLAEQALIVARDEADRANQAKSDFLSSMSHELRTPMNAILGFGQLMEYDDSLSGEQQDNVQEILKAGHHLLNLINEVLDLSKVESGSIDLSLEPVEVCPVVDECLALVGPLADKRDISLMHTGLSGVMVRADRTRLKQVLLNLLSNAIKYNREGGTVKLDIAYEGSDRLRIRVTDTGAGIPANRLAELFLPFNRLDAEGSEIEGTGIGLTITRRIVELMGGSVDVMSEVGVGSSFWIELPLEIRPGSIQAAEPSSATDSAQASHINPAQKIVLYIEDNPSNLKLVAQILGRRKHLHLLTAHTPELGIELARARHPDLILLDINMPGMDGYQVLEVFKADPLLKGTPVVAVTANAMPRDFERGVGAGFVEYLTKPLDVMRFHEVIDQCLNQPKGLSHRQPVDD